VGGPPAVGHQCRMGACREGLFEAPILVRGNGVQQLAIHKEARSLLGVVVARARN